MPDTPRSLDPRSPLVVSTRDLPRSPGAMRPAVFTASAPAELGTPMIGVPAGSPLEFDLRMEWVTEGVLVSGTVSGTLRGECGRCLRPIEEAASAELRELFALPESATGETTEEDEVGRLHGELVDLEPAVRVALVLDLPVNPLCRPDCPGLCPECGVPLDEVPDDHHHDQIDPRWSALSTLSLAPETDRPEPPDRS